MSNKKELAEVREWQRDKDKEDKLRDEDRGDLRLKTNKILAGIESTLKHLVNGYDNLREDIKEVRDQNRDN